MFHKKTVCTLFALLLTMGVLFCRLTAASAETVSTVSESLTSASPIETSEDAAEAEEEPSAAITLIDGASVCDSSSVIIDGDCITVTEAGTYLVSGTLSDGQIRIDTDKESKVKLILDGASIANSTGAAIYVLSADKLVLNLAEGSMNSLSSDGSFEQTDDNNVDAAVFSKDDLTFSGNGTLSVSSSGHGIVCKNDLKIKGGLISVTASDKGISANDSITIDGGSVTVVSGDDAVNCEGDVSVNAGILNLSTGDDGIHGDLTLTVSGGTIDVVKSHEGLEASSILISDGVITIVSSDDGINAAGGTDGSGSSDFFSVGRGGNSFNETGSSLTISGGILNINAQGDGLDANGDLTVSGGTIFISGPTDSGNGALDFTIGSISGGTLIAASASGMAINFGNGSTQGSILYHFSAPVSAGSEITLTDSKGEVLASFTPEKEFQSVVISCPELEQGSHYTLNAGAQSADIALSSLIYGSGGGMGMGGMGRGGFRPDGSSGMPEGFSPDGDGDMPGRTPSDPRSGDFPQGGHGHGGQDFAPNI